MQIRTAMAVAQKGNDSFEGHSEPEMWSLIQAKGDPVLDYWVNRCYKRQGPHKIDSLERRTRSEN